MKLSETEDNSIEAMVHQGKSIAQWEKDFNGEFTAEQLAKMARGQVDLQKLLFSNDLNETDDELTEDNRQSIKDYIMPTTELRIFSKKTGELLHTVYFDPIALEPAFGYANWTAYQLLPKDMLKNIKQIGWVDGVIYVDGEPITEKDVPAIKARMERVQKNLVDFSDLKESSDPLDLDDVRTVKDFIKTLYAKAKQDDDIVFVIGNKKISLFDIYSKNRTTVIEFMPDGKQNKLSEKEDMKSEGYSWKRGGYGGTGRSYSSLGSDAPRGAAISWYSVSDFDPKAKGKMFGWRCGPSNFPFEDLLYPNRKYKIGTMVMRNKYIKAGSLSGEKYIAIPSYFDSIKNNDEAAIGLLNALGIPLDLTFGMDPNDDYSMTYVEK